MANGRILTLDVGVSKVALSEFIIKKGAAPVLSRYAMRAVDSLGADVATRSMESLSGVVRELAAEAGMKPGPLHVLLPGSAVFPRFVKLPKVSPEKLDEMVRYEAGENLPFPIEEVVWDYQSIGETDAGEYDMLIVATKNDNAADAAACAEGAGLPLALVDATPLALYNCAVNSHPEIGSKCAIVLDIGARSTTLVILDNGKVFVRGINVGGNVITNEIARGLAISPEEAENIKKEIGFVALGGTYASEDETADKVSKIIRNVVTRLHSEVARSINFYRVQQGGSAPEKLFLTGGSSLTSNIDSFFAEKLQLEVEYLNPFNAVTIAPGLDNQEELLLLAPSVGLAVRAAGLARVTIDLTPPAVIAAQRFVRRIPMFGVSVVCLVLAIICWVMHAKNLQTVYSEQKAKVEAPRDERKADKAALLAVQRENTALTEKDNYLQSAVSSRSSYVQLLQLIRASQLKDTWITSFAFSEDGEDTYLDLAVKGFKIELDKLPNSMKQEKSVGEILLDRILAADRRPRPASTADDGAEPAEAPRRGAEPAADGYFFSPAGSSVQGQPLSADGKLVQIELRLKMAAKIGEINANNNLPTELIAK